MQAYMFGLILRILQTEIHIGMSLVLIIPWTGRDSAVW